MPSSFCCGRCPVDPATQVGPFSLCECDNDHAGCAPAPEAPAAVLRLSVEVNERNARRLVPALLRVAGSYSTTTLSRDERAVLAALGRALRAHLAALDTSVPFALARHDTDTAEPAEQP